MSLVFLSGPHGGGKTTLACLLEKEVESVLMPTLETRTPKFYTDMPRCEVSFSHRAALKHCQKAIENYEALEIARKSPDRAVLGNRCIYDNLAYTHAYAELGWISREQEKKLESHLDIIYQGELKNPWAVVLNPGFDVAKRHLEKRWAEKPKKFMEEDLCYLDKACRAYVAYKEHPKVCYINHEIDLDGGKDLARIKEWLFEATMKQVFSKNYSADAHAAGGL